MTQVRPSHWLVRWLREHPAAADAVLAGVIAALGVLLHLTIRDPKYSDPSAVGVLLVLGGTIPLA